MSANTDRHQNAVAGCFEAWNAGEAGEKEALPQAVAAARAAEGGTEHGRPDPFRDEFPRSRWSLEDLTTASGGTTGERPTA